MYITKYGTLLKRLCEKDNTVAYNSLSKNYYIDNDSENGDYYACKAGISEMCHSDSEATDSNESNETNIQKDSKTCKTKEERMQGCVYKETYNDGSYELTPYKNGKKEGKAKSYYISGKIKGEADL